MFPLSSVASFFPPNGRRNRLIRGKEQKHTTHNKKHVLTSLYSFSSPPSPSFLSQQYSLKDLSCLKVHLSFSLLNQLQSNVCPFPSANISLQNYRWPPHHSIQWSYINLYLISLISNVCLSWWLSVPWNTFFFFFSSWLVGTCSCVAFFLQF